MKLAERKQVEKENKMKDMKILKELRQGPMKTMKDDEYAMIEEEVSQKGISGIKGYAKYTVEKAMRDMAYSMKDKVLKHGEHDQASHGSWAGNGAGGKNIQDMSASDQKEFIDRMSSAKSGAEQRTIIDEFAGRQKGGKKGGEYSVKNTTESAGGSYHRVDATTTPSNLDKLFGKGKEMLGDEYERKVTEQWTAKFTNKATGKSFVASVYDWMRYDDKGMTAEQGQKIPLLGRGESHSFHISADSKEQAQIVKDFISANQSSGVNKATSVKTGDMVSWQASGGTARGRVEHIMREGVLGIPKSSFSIKAEKDDPAVLIRIYKNGKETETLVGHKMSTLNKNASL